MTDTRTAPVRTAVTVVSTYQWYGAGPWRDASDSRLFDDFEPFAGGTAVRGIHLTGGRCSRRSGQGFGITWLRCSGIRRSPGGRWATAGPPAGGPGWAGARGSTAGRTAPAAGAGPGTGRGDAPG